MTEAERRGLRALLGLLLIGQACVMACRHWPEFLPDVVRGAAPISAARADPAAAPAVAGAAPPARSPAVHHPASSPALAPHALDINAADAAALCALPGIGSKKAAAILEERRRGGRFRSVADLTRVRGIGPATVARLAPWLRCDPPVRAMSARER